MKRVYVLLAVVLFVLIMAGCAANTPTPTVEQPMPYDTVEQRAETFYPFDEMGGYSSNAPISTDEQQLSRSDTVEQDVRTSLLIDGSSEETDKKNDAEHSISEFAPDWDAITHRAAELLDFFKDNLEAGLTVDDVKRELGLDAVSVYHDSTIQQTTYIFELMTAPNHEHYPYVGELLRTGYVGLFVQVTTLNGGDIIDRFLMAHGDPSGSRTRGSSYVLTGIRSHFFTDWVWI